MGGGSVCGRSSDAPTYQLVRHTRTPSPTTRDPPRNRIMGIQQPAERPTLRCLPDRVSGIPIARDSLPFAAEMPTARFHEKENPYFLPISPPLPDGQLSASNFGSICRRSYGVVLTDLSPAYKYIHRQCPLSFPPTLIKNNYTGWFYGHPADAG